MKLFKITSMDGTVDTIKTVESAHTEYYFDLIPALSAIQKCAVVSDLDKSSADNVQLAKEQLYDAIMAVVPEAVGSQGQFKMTQKDNEKVIQNALVSYILINHAFPLFDQRLEGFIEDIEALKSGELESKKLPFKYQYTHEVALVKDFNINTSKKREQTQISYKNGQWLLLTHSAHQPCVATTAEICSEILPSIFYTITAELKKQPVNLTDPESLKLKAAIELIESVSVFTFDSIIDPGFSTADGFFTSMMDSPDMPKLPEEIKDKPIEKQAGQLASHVSHIPVEVAKSHLDHFASFKQKLETEIQNGRALTEMKKNRLHLDEIIHKYGAFREDMHEYPNATESRTRQGYTEFMIPLKDLFETNGATVRTGCPAIAGGIIKKILIDYFIFDLVLKK